MTTIVTVQTGVCPAAASLNSNGSESTPQHQSYHHSHTTVFVEAESKRDFTLSAGVSFGVVELPEGTTGLSEEPGSAKAVG